MTERRADAIRVLIVDDSVVMRGALGRIIDAEHDMYVATTATNGRDALEALRQQRVDVVLLDIDMPVMDGLTALPLIIARHRDVSVLITSSLTAAGGTIAARALVLGAADYVHKPTARGVGGVEAVAVEITSKVRAVARSMAARIAAERKAKRAVSVDSVHPAPLARLAAVPRLLKPWTAGTAEFQPRILALAASTGGPNALTAVLSKLPGDFHLPVVVTQHMPPIFTTMFAQRLAKQGELPCEEASDGMTLLPGHIYIAPGDHHLTITTVGAARTPVASINREPPEHHCRPAADPMFRSLARSFSNGVVAVVLTGMGEDGRQGCDAIVRSGGRIIVQDQATSVVWGMPGSVVNSGVPCTVLPLNAIAAHISQICGARSS
ncbi:MAG: protein-glutamate methylesterase/protein-glutamine glutaminase [Gemmatimonadaceae bacterium]